nr:MAG TPA: hypothetical protein [Caudoviricetes sp.]
MFFFHFINFIVQKVQNKIIIVIDNTSCIFSYIIATSFYFF